MCQARTGPRKLYRGSYFIVFYDESDEELRYLFDNVRDILKFMKRPVTRTNINLVNVELYRAFKRRGHFTRFLTGEKLRAYMIAADIDDDDDINYNKETQDNGKACTNSVEYDDQGDNRVAEQGCDEP